MVTQRISRVKALDLMKGTSGKFFTATFIKKDGSRRDMNCTYRADQPTADLGYVLVEDTALRKVDPTRCTRSVNIQTLEKLKINGIVYRIG